MSTLADLLIQKQAAFYVVPEGLCVLDATRVMNEHGVGAVGVIQGPRLVGIFTERDVLRRVVAAGRSPSTTRVSAVMTGDVIYAQPDMSIEEARCLMKHRRIRHLPVLTETDEPIGMISIGDLNAWQCARQESEIFHLQEYLYGRV